MAASLIHCGVSVEANGRPIHVEKGAKEVGMQVIETGTGGPHVKVVGFKRDLRYTARNIQQIVDNRLGEGRLAIVGKDRTKVLLTKAQPSQLELIVRCLRGELTSTSKERQAKERNDVRQQQVPGAKRQRVHDNGDTPARVVKAPVSISPLIETTKAIKQAAAESKESLASLAELPVHLVDMVFSFEPPDATSLARLAETCSILSMFVMDRRQSALRLAPSRGAGIPVDRVVQAVVRRPVLDELVLSGYAEFTPAAASKLSDFLVKAQRLQVLKLRGCRLLTDAAVKRLLTSCPTLQVLDLLEIPRLSNQCLRTPLPKLTLLAAGNLGRPAASDRAVANAMRPQNVSSVSVVIVQQPGAKAQGTCKFTSSVLCSMSPAANVSKTGLSERSALQAWTPPLTHLVLANCAELEALPALSDSLRLLDLRGASLRGPGAEIQNWSPLATCRQLEVLCLAGNAMLGSTTILAMLKSLPAGAKLRVLDLSATRSDLMLFRTLPTVPCVSALTHLRLSGCQGLQNQGLAILLQGLRSTLEVLDVAGSRALEAPLSEIAPHLPKLRIFAVGQTDFALQIDSTRKALRVLAPGSQAVTGSWDVFQGYANFPPVLL